MSHPPHAASKHPRTLLAGPYGHPFHPIAVIIPIGAWTASVLFDILAMVESDPAPFALGARLLILIGLIGAAVAAVLGVLDWLSIPAGTRARATGTAHLIINVAVMGLFLASLLVRPTPDEVSTLGFALSIAALLLLCVSGWLGGKLAYRFGVRVADERTQAEGYEPTPSMQAPRGV